ncbi:MAG: OmpA family protein [Nitrospira sp.]|nr:OmpA family protein [Nitrospira sp.]MCW5786854.1 OmpA family protein [Nitrospira sp.]MDR4473305.1 OmpA family protein [Nitrospira sp.]MDR4474832.1 OmpA family protein [Nitrospira sp.]
MRASLTILSCILMANTAAPIYAQEAQSVRLGQAALTYAAGSIRQDMPVEGVVNAITGDNQLAGNRMMLGWSGTDRLYLKLNKPGEAALGDLYTVYRRARKVFHPMTKQYLGYVINRVGVVKVVQVDPLLVGVQVVRSYAPISTGDPVARFTPPAAEEIVESASTGSDVEAMIVELQSDKHMSLVAQGNIVYLDKGQADGLHAGDCLEVFRTGGGLPERKMGEVKVLSTEAHTAAAVISKAVARVLIGDRLRPKHVSPVQQALQSDQREEDLPAATFQPVTVANSHSAASAQQEPRAANKAGDERLRGGIRLNLDDLADQLEYESGEVKIKSAGMPILEQVAEYLTTAAGSQQVRVEGHSDNMEIGPSLKGAFPTNWELSKARAGEIVRYLVEKGGMDSAKLSAVGYGASRPVASNGTEAGRKKNRRIEIVLESPESGALPQSVKVPVTEGEAGPAQYSDNQLGSASATGDGLPAASAIQPVATSSEVPADRAPAVPDVIVPVTPADAGTPPPTSGS